MLAHLKRELMHAIWDLLLSPEFIHAYVHGLVVRCYDGVERLVFPRFMTYGADYPEK
jgi:3-deoxy-D-arabino-heptulosonate 7-phosphate (DAHP) synthase